MPNFNLFQSHKQQSTAMQAPHQDHQVKSTSTRPTTLLSTKYKVLNDGFLNPDSDDHADMDTEGDDYELTDDELLDYGRPGRRQAAKKQGFVSPSSEDKEGKWPLSLSSEVSKMKENLNGKRTKQSANGLQETEVRISLRDKTNVNQNNSGFLHVLRR